MTKLDKEPRKNRKTSIIKISNAKHHALVVEDHTPNIVITTSFLHELGYDCDVAESGLKALNKFSANRYDLVIMDIQLPDMDGFETARRIRTMEKEKTLAPAVILAVTGNATEDDRLLCLKAGMNDYLSKPFLFRELADKLQNFFGKA